MKKKFAFIMTYACVAFLGGAGLMLLLFAEKSPRASEKENRMLAGFPECSLATLADGSFMTGLESYLSDAMFDRDGIVDFTSRVSALFSVNEEDTDLESEVAAFAAEGGEETETVAVTADADSASAETAEVTETGDSTQGEETATADAEATEDTGTTVDGTGETTQADAADDQTEDTLEEEDSAEPEGEEEEYDPFAVELDEEGWGKCAFWHTDENGKTTRVYSFSVENLKNAADVLNAYRAILPEDGKMYFAQIPFHSTGLGMQGDKYVDWGCNVEEMLRAHTDDGVVIVSAPDVLKDHLNAGEYLYFYTDHHWTPKAACYLAQAFLETQGITTYAYDDYRYHIYHGFYGSHANTESKRVGVSPDTIDVLIPSLPTESYTIDATGEEKESYFMVNTNSYMSYLRGTQGPWRRFVSGVHTGRNCLVIGDSYSNCFIPYLTPYYDNVYSTDLRTAYFSLEKAGCTVTEFVQSHDISDIYFIPSTASSLNSNYMLSHLWKYL